AYASEALALLNKKKYIADRDGCRIILELGYTLRWADYGGGAHEPPPAAPPPLVTGHGGAHAAGWRLDHGRGAAPGREGQAPGGGRIAPSGPRDGREGHHRLEADRVGLDPRPGRLGGAVRRPLRRGRAAAPPRRGRGPHRLPGHQPQPRDHPGGPGGGADG